MKRLSALVAAFALALASPASAQSLEVSENFQGTQLNWGRGGTIIVRWQPAIVDGKIAICGAFMHQGRGRNTDAVRVIKDMRINKDGNAILLGLDFFRRVDDRNAYDALLVGQTSDCRITQTAGSQADLQGLSLSLSRQRY